MSVEIIDTLKPKNNGNFPVAAAEDIKGLDYVTPEMYGAVGDGVTDDTAALQAAIATNRAVVLDAKQYKISDSLVNPYKLIGSGKRTQIVMTDTSKPIIHITQHSDGIHLEGFLLKYADSTVAVASNNVSTAIGIKLDNKTCSVSIFNNIYIYDTYTAILSEGEFFSCTFSNIWVNHYAYAAIYFSGVGSTGCVFSNIYTTNWQDYSTRTMNKATFGIYLANYTESIMQQINVEHARLRSPLLFVGCDNIKIDSIHFEGIVTTDNYNGIIGAINSKVIISTMTMVYSGSNSEGYQPSDTTATSVYVFYLLGTDAPFTTLIKCTSVYLRNNAWNYASSNKAIAYSNGESANIQLDIEEFKDRNSLISGTVGFINNIRKPQVKSDGVTTYYEKTHSGSITRYIATTPLAENLAGVFNAGDKFVPRVPTNDNIFMWVVTSKGNISEPECTAKGKYIQFESMLYLTTNDSMLKYGETITIGEERFTLTSNPYQNSTYSGYPYAVNLNKNVQAESADNVTIKIAPPLITALKYAVDESDT